MSTRRYAQDLARYGRNGDTLLLHVHPVEVSLLDWALRAAGGQGVTVNPATGLPEAFSFWDVLPLVAGAAGTAVGGPMGGLAASSLAGAGKTAAQGGSAQQALLSGLATGGLNAATAGLGGSLAGTAAGQAAGGLGAEAAGQAATQAATQGLAGQTAADMALQQYGSSAAQAAIPQAAELATAGPLAGAGSASAQMSALPQQAMTPGMQTMNKDVFGPATDPFTPAAGMPAGQSAAQAMQASLNAPVTPAESTLWNKTKEFATSKYALPAAVVGAAGIGALMDRHKGGGGDEEIDWSKGPKEYTSYERLGTPTRTGGPTSESQYFRPVKKRFAKGRAIDLPAKHGDGMADKTPAVIDNGQPAALSSGEYVVPADVVSHLGNGSSAAGVKTLDEMLKRTRKARTGAISQAPKLNPKKVLPR